MAQIARHLVEANHVVHIVTAAPEFVFLDLIQSGKLHLRKVTELAKFSQVQNPHYVERIWDSHVLTCNVKQTN